MKLPGDIETEDRGDGRSRIHAVHVPVQTTAYVRLQRGPEGYTARLKRLGYAYMDRALQVTAPDPETAVRRVIEMAHAEAP